MAFAAVQFMETDEVAIISSSWLTDETTCKWPPYEDKMLIKRAVLEKRAPESNWENHSIFIIGVHKTYAGAKKDVDKALQSDSDSNDKTPEIIRQKVQSVLQNSNCRASPLQTVVVIKKECLDSSSSTEIVLVPDSSLGLMLAEQTSTSPAATARPERFLTPVSCQQDSLSENMEACQRSDGNKLVDTVTDDTTSKSLPNEPKQKKRKTKEKEGPYPQILDVFIKHALPEAEDDVIDKVVERLKELGVVFIEDAKYVEASHLSHILKPIQVMKLLAFFANIRKTNFPETSQFTCTKEAYQEENTNQITSTSVSPLAPQNWAEDFEIPWNLFPEEVLELCEGEKRLKRSLYSQMVRILADSITNFNNQRPGQKNLRIIAKKIVSKYPLTFEDRVDGTVIADGCTTLMKKIQNCIDNRRRNKSGSMLFTGQLDAIIKKSLKKSYACKEWQPNHLPLGESKISQLQHKEWMIFESRKLVRNESKINELMIRTYASQRSSINSNRSVKHIAIEWPILMENKYFFKHAEILLGKENCADIIIKNINTKGKIIYNFMRDINTKGKIIYNFMKGQTSNVNIIKCLMNIETAKEQLKNNTPEIFGAISLVMAYFGEQEEALFQTNMEPVCKYDLEDSSKEHTPVLVTSGGTIYAAKEYFVVIDGTVTLRASDFPTGLALMFLSYYVFNIEYPEEAPLTMEFIQRIIADINPNWGTKLPKSNGKSFRTVTSQVVKLTNKLRDFESSFNP